MTARTLYYYRNPVAASNPVGGLRRRWDSDLGFTEWDIAGNVTTQRPLTADEAADLALFASNATADQNGSTLRAAAVAAMAANRDFLAFDFTNPALTVPQILQALVPQVRALTRQMNAFGRLYLDQLGGTD